MNKQKGFGLVEVLLILFAFSALSFVGYIVWSRNQNNDLEYVSMAEYCNAKIWNETKKSYKVTCSVSVIFKEPFPDVKTIEEIIKPINGKISSNHDSLQSIGIYYISVELGQEESASEYLRSLPIVVEAKQESDSASINLQ